MREPPNQRHALRHNKTTVKYMPPLYRVGQRQTEHTPGVVVEVLPGGLHTRTPRYYEQHARVRRSTGERKYNAWQPCGRQHVHVTSCGMLSRIRRVTGASRRNINADTPNGTMPRVNTSSRTSRSRVYSVNALRCYMLLMNGGAVNTNVYRQLKCHQLQLKAPDEQTN